MGQAQAEALWVHRTPDSRLWALTALMPSVVLCNYFFSSATQGTLARCNNCNHCNDLRPLSHFSRSPPPLPPPRQSPPHPTNDGGLAFFHKRLLSSFAYHLDLSFARSMGLSPTCQHTVRTSKEAYIDDQSNRPPGGVCVRARQGPAKAAATHYRMSRHAKCLAETTRHQTENRRAECVPPPLPVAP